MHARTVGKMKVMMILHVTCHLGTDGRKREVYRLALLLPIQRKPPRTILALFVILPPSLEAQLPPQQWCVFLRLGPLTIARHYHL